MKSKKIFFSLATACAFLSVGKVSAQIDSPTTYRSFSDLMEAIVNYAFGLSFVIAPLMLIIAGFYFVTATGNERQIATGKNILLYTMVGFLIIIMAKGVIGLIQMQFGI